MTLVAPPDESAYERDLEAITELEQRLLHEGGVFNIIADSTVAGIGPSELVSTYPEMTKGERTGRNHDQWTVALNGHRHSVLVTNPLAAYSEEDFYFFPGFTQTTDQPGGVGFRFHQELAKRHPEARIISIASTGIGQVGDRTTDPQMTSMEAMGAQRYYLMHAISGDRPKRLITLSMGTVIGNRLVQLDLADDQKLKLVSSVKYEPAQVDPARVPLDMLLKFPALMLPDVAREVFDARNILSPRRLFLTIRTLSHLGLRPADVPALLGQVVSLANGTDTQLTAAEADSYHVHVIAGALDPLSQQAMWREQQNRNPKNITLRFVPGKGHGMAADPVGGAAHVSRAIKTLHLIP